MDDDTRRELDSLRLTSQLSVHRMWQLLIRPLGWRTTTLYIGFVDAERRPIPYLAEVPDSDEVPDPDACLFGRRLLEGGRRAGVPVEPIHVADDHAIRALTPDDLAA